MAKPAFAVGAQVEHPKFGLGAVTACTEEQIAIKFDEHGEKKFVLSIVQPNLKKSDRQPPAEKKRATRKKASTEPKAKAAVKNGATSAEAVEEKPSKSKAK